MFDFLKKKLNEVVKKVTDTVAPKLSEEHKGKKLDKETITKKIVKAFTEITVTEEKIEDIFQEIEIDLLEADVAVEVIDKIKEDLKKELVGKSIKKSELEKNIKNVFRKTIKEILDIPKIDLIKKIEKKPTLFVFLGFNGSGKTTTMAKIAYWLQTKNFSCVFAAGDSFRAASIEQLEEHAKKLKINVIKHQYGADPAAVIFDAVKYAQAKKIDVVLADTAGRTHTNKNLMDQLEKIVRVNKPDLKILVIDSMTGNDIINQCRMFDRSVGVDALVLTKTDVSNKGGSILSAAFVIKKPILFLGTGQEYKDIQEYDANKIAEKLL